VSIERVRSFVEKMGRLEEERAALADDIAEIERQAADAGLDVACLRECVRLRNMEPGDRRSEHLAREQSAAQLGGYLRASGVVL
jgi:uncharacterized protein (UPF0335 family)